MTRWKLFWTVWVGICLTGALLVFLAGPRTWHTKEDAPLEPIEPALPDDGSWATWRAATVAVAEDHDEAYQELRKALPSKDELDMARIEPLRPAIAEMVDALPDPLGMTGFRVPASSFLGEPVEGEMPDDSLTPGFALLGDAALRAYDGDAEAAADSLRRAHRLGVLYEHSGPSLIAVMVGVTLQGRALRLGRDLAQRIDVSGLADDAQAASELPSGVAAGVLGECMKLEHHFRTLTTGGKSATADRGSVPATIPPIYLPGRTIALHRWRCRQLIAGALAPVEGQEELEFPALWRPADPRTWLDNPIGRVLLDLASPNYTSMASRRASLATDLAAMEAAAKTAAEAAAKTAAEAAAKTAASMD